MKCRRPGWGSVFGAGWLIGDAAEPRRVPALIVAARLLLMFQPRRGVSFDRSLAMTRKLKLAVLHFATNTLRAAVLALRAAQRRY
jgi:hypothetical protein